MTTDSITITFHKEFYTCGDVIEGDVLIECLKPINSKFLRIKVEGFEETKWSHKMAEKPSLPQVHSRREDIISLYRTLSGHNFSLKAGLNTFPFSFKLPSDCPPSFDGKYGGVRYLVKCELDRPEPWRFNDKIQAEFLVIPKVDLNSVFNANKIIDKNLSKNTGMVFKNGRVFVRAQLPRTGYTPGEDIPILIRIDNQSCKPTTRARAYLQQTAIFTANPTNLYSTKIHDGKLEKSEVECCVPPFQSDTILLNLRIPELTTPSFKSKLIRISYNVIVALDTLSVFEGTLEWEFPIVIGTVPIGNTTTSPEKVFEEPSALEEPLSMGPPPSYEESRKRDGFLGSPPDYKYSSFL